MKKLFAVIRSHGDGWKRGRPLEEQEEWRAHADFMDGLDAEGFVALAGPLGEDDAMIIVRAESEEAVHERLKPDPWTASGMLRTARVAEWTLRIGKLP
jgi:uncharacterized protein YciI